MAPQTATKLTYEDYVKLPDDGKRYEIIDGELYVNPAPAPRHQWILGNLYLALRLYLDGSGGGRVFIAPLDVVLSSENILQPDLLVIKSERAGLLGERNMQGAPDLAVEVISEGTRRKDVVVKRRLYEKFGVDEYWIVDPEIESVQVYRRHGESLERVMEVSTETGGNITSPLLPNFTLEVNRIFTA